MKSRQAFRAMPFLVSRALATALNAVLLVVLATLAPVEAFGALITATATLVAMGILFDLGANGLVIRVRSEDPSSTLIPALIKLNLLTNLGLLAIGVVAILSLALALQSWEMFILLAPLAIAIPIEKATQFATQIHLADGRLTKCGTNLVGQRMIHISVFVPAQLMTESAATYSFAYVVAALVGRLHMGKYPVAGTESATLRTAVRRGLPFLANSAGGHLRNFDLLVVSILGGTVAASVYGLPARLGAAALFLPTAVAPLIISALARGYRVDLRIRPRHTLLLGPILIAVAAFIIIGSSATSIVASPEYIDVGTTARYYFAGLVPLVLSTLGIAMLLGIGQERVLAFSSVAFNFLLLLAVAIGVMADGPAGAAVGFAATQMLQFMFISRQLIIVHRTGSFSTARSGE